MSRAERFIYIFYATAAIAVASLVTLKKFPRAATVLSVAALLAGFACLGVGSWIARAGGEVSHSEFRAEGSIPEAPAHEHQHGHNEKAESGRAETSPASQAHEHTPPATQGEAAHGDHGKAAPTTATTNNPQPEHQHSPDSTQTTSDATPDHAHADHSTALQSSTNNSQSAHEHHTVAPETNAQPASSHQHDHTSSSAPAHSRGTNAPSANWTPDTPEGIWTELHRHQAELQAAIAAKKLDEIHAHAEAIKHLTAALVDVVHPDYKASVEKGAERINQAITAAHKSAHAEDIAGLETNFKLFEEALSQLQEQMRKQ
jgi:hypothetical protein